MSCTCNKGESTACCLILFINSCEKKCLKLCTYLKQLKIVKFVCRSEIVYFRVPVLLVLLAYTLVQVSGCIVFFFFFFFFVIFFFFYFMHKNLHNCFGHLDIPRSLVISL